MSYRPHGKHVSIDINSPRALGICDYTGFVFNRADLVKQMEYRGNDLVWTGFYVGRPYLSEPQPQLMPPIVLGDPYPIEDPRPPQGCTETFSNNTLPVISEINLPINQIGNIQDGAPAPPQSQRQALLDQGIAPVLVANGTPNPVENALTQAQLRAQLENASWTSS
jgi:hypothetical protein